MLLFKKNVGILAFKAGGGTDVFNGRNGKILEYQHP
jgi:hypothetical protein